MEQYLNQQIIYKLQISPDYVIDSGVVRFLSDNGKYVNINIYG